MPPLKKGSSRKTVSKNIRTLKKKVSHRNNLSQFLSAKHVGARKDQSTTLNTKVNSMIQSIPPHYVDYRGAHLICVNGGTPVEVVDNRETIIDNAIFEFKGRQTEFPDCVTFKRCQFINCNDLPDANKMIDCYT